MVREQPLKECERCEAINSSTGVQCKNRTCKSKFCWIHLKSQRGLRIKPSSTGFGDGLYTTRRIAPNSRIGTYGGQEMSKARVDRLYRREDPKYVLCASQKCVDGRKTNSSAVRYANSARGTGRRNNTRLSTSYAIRAPYGANDTYPIFQLRSQNNRSIAAGTELLTSYGGDYTGYN